MAADLPDEMGVTDQFAAASAGTTPAYPWGHEGEVRALVDVAMTYGAHHPDVFGGAWPTYIDGNPRACVSFTADIERHRAALDERVLVLPASRTLADLRAAREDLAEYVATTPGIRRADIAPVVGGPDVLAVVQAADEATVAREIHELLGDAVDLYFERVEMRQIRPLRRTSNASSKVISATWPDGLDGHRPWLQVVETNREVRVKCFLEIATGFVHSDYATTQGIYFGSALLPAEATATAELDRPLGNRTLVWERPMSDVSTDGAK